MARTARCRWRWQQECVLGPARGNRLAVLRTYLLIRLHVLWKDVALQTDHRRWYQSGHESPDTLSTSSLKNVPSLII
eukprot:1187332-Pyramimonas_sp.AAC.1